MPVYNPATIEPRWQAYWDEHQTFRTPDMPIGEKLYVLDMFPYPSGAGLHVGHPEGYTATDIRCRYARMRGKTVLHPMGFDAFGLPAEEYAIRTNTPPRVSTKQNIATFRRQLKMLGFSYDWNRELATTDVDYFRWTQWIFLVLFDTWYDTAQQKGRPIAELPIPGTVSAEGEHAVALYQDRHRLAIQSDALVNWCPQLGTVLANEEVIDGKSERGGYPVQRIPLRQWMLRITAYGDRLEQDLELVNWSESIKTLQKNWIGRSVGAEVDFFLGSETEFSTWSASRKQAGFPDVPGNDVLRVYTTRPDTLFGATYMVIAPEHPLIEALTTKAQAADVQNYVQKAGNKSDLERTELAKDKTGVFTGSYAINAVTGKPIPVWVADYVLAGYGTGAIMAVPAHDVRDFEFAQKYDLPVVAVVDPGADAGVDRAAVLRGELCWTGPGLSIQSDGYDGLTVADFKQRIIEKLTKDGTGKAAVNYKLRDWLFSRQRFWGEPFPILHELDDAGKPNGRIRGVPIEMLPVDLPKLDDYKPHGRPEPPLGKAPQEWLYVELDGKRYRRETNTMPQWAGSCWYYLRFIDPTNDRQFIDPVKEKAWMPVDMYIGGAEHAVLHLLYARFWHKVLFDRGYVSTPEPFARLVNQGMILGEIEFTGFKNGTRWISANDVRTLDDGTHADKQTGEPAEPITVTLEDVEKASGESWVLKEHPSIRVTGRSHKMSKARGNVVNPDEVVSEYGADSLRLYEMFMGPLEATKPWDMNGVSGVRKFLDRLWRLIVDDRAEEMTLSPNLTDEPPSPETNRILNKTIAKVTDDTEALAYNTAISAMMECVNFLTKLERRPRQAVETLTLLVAPYAPHLAEELWKLLGHSDTLAYAPWPEADPSLAADDVVDVPVQIRGKTRVVLRLPSALDEAALEAAARADDKVRSYLGETPIKKVVVISKGPRKLINFVI